MVAAAGLVGRIAASGLLRTRLARELFAPRAIEIAVDGAPLDARAFTIAGAASVRDVGLGFRPFLTRRHRPRALPLPAQRRERRPRSRSSCPRCGSASTARPRACTTTPRAQREPALRDARALERSTPTCTRPPRALRALGLGADPLRFVLGCRRLLAFRALRYPYRHADVAQLVEQLIRNQQVTGSSPVIGSRHPPDAVCSRPRGEKGPP